MSSLALLDLDKSSAFNFSYGNTLHHLTSLDKASPGFFHPTYLFPLQAKMDESWGIQAPDSQVPPTGLPKPYTSSPGPVWHCGHSPPSRRQKRPLFCGSLIISPVVPALLRAFVCTREQGRKPRPCDPPLDSGTLLLIGYEVGMVGRQPSWETQQGEGGP